MRFNYDDMTLRERTELLDMLELVPDNKRAVAIGLMREILTLSDILSLCRSEINENGIIIQFGNENLKEHPSVKTYNTSIGRYAQLMKQFCSLIPDEEKEPDALEEFMSA